MNYDAIVSIVTSYTENDGAEFTAALPDIIQASQREIERDLDNYGFVFHAYASVSSGDPFVSKPTNTYVIKDLAVLVSGNYIPMRMRTFDFLRTYWPARTSVGIPKYYSNWDNETIIVAPAFISATTVEMTYTAPLSALSTSVSSNYITDFAANALIYKTIENSYLFMKEPTKAGLFKAKYDEERSRLLNEARRARRDDLQYPSNPSGENTQTGEN